MGEAGPRPIDDAPRIFASKPSAGRNLAEVFAGDPHKGGGVTSEAWEEDCGVAFRYDVRTDKSRGFLRDEWFWTETERNPGHAYVFNVPTATWWIDGIGQSLEATNPFGNEWDLPIAHANRLLRLVAKRVLLVVSMGCGFLIEAPFGCYLWDLDDMLRLLAVEGAEFVRSDCCAFGATYRRSCGL